MINVEIFNSYFIIEADPKTIDEIDNFFSFKNKAAEYEYVRLIKGHRAKLMRQEELPEWYPEWYRQKSEELKRKIKVSACRRPEPNSGIIMVPIGLLERSRQIPALKDVVYQEYRNFDIPRKHLNKGNKKLRRPQEEALKALEDRTHGLIKLPTGVGKTLLAEELIYKLGYRTLFLVPSASILNQTVRRFKDRFGDKLVGEFSGKKKQDDKWITVATYQSVNAMEGTFDNVDVVIADEVHHIGAETFFTAVVSKTPNAIYKYGLSAYEERADGGTILVHAGVGEIAYEFSAREAIAEGYLAKPTYIIYKIMKTAGTFTKWKMQGKKRVDLGKAFAHPINDKDTLKLYKNWILGNDMLTEKILNMSEGFLSEGKSVLVLVDEIEHINKFSELLKNSKLEYGICTGGNKENEKTIARFNSRSLKLLFGTSTIGEGTDLIPVDVLINLQGGASISQTKQAAGRAFRNDTDPVTGEIRKPTCLVIDFDFPLSDLLSKHSGIRQKVYKETGDVLHEMLDL